MSARSLQFLATAETSFYSTQALQLRNEPLFLRGEIEAAATSRLELIPDAQGNAQTSAQLLNSSRYVAQQARFTIANTLIAVGKWATIAKYLEDIADLDDEKGRFGAPKRRSELLSCAQFLVDSSLESFEKRVRYGIYTHSTVAKFWVREPVSIRDFFSVWTFAHIRKAGLC